jgi:succinyl-CoA synthetase beta subunit
MDIKGHTVKKVMIAQGARIAEEYYFSMLLDRANRTYLAMCSKEGGMDIETLAVEHPEKLARIAVDPIVGSTRPRPARSSTRPASTRRLAAKIATCSSDPRPGVCREDATLVEVNPLVKTEDGQIVALDGKVTLDNNAVLPPPRARGPRRPLGDRPVGAVLAIEKDLNYVKLDGNIGIIGNGAGLVMSHPRRGRLRGRRVHRQATAATRRRARGTGRLTRTKT